MPGAQLTGHDSEEKWEREHWEDEIITYGCDNASLVINNQKGLKTRNYVCKVGGGYNTPKGGTDAWPTCTTNPTDPCKNRNISSQYILKSFFLCRHCDRGKTADASV